jgi:hypothetical protein
MQVLYDCDRQQDAEPAVVLAAVAHGVVVRAGDQRFRVRIGGGVAAGHVAGVVDVDVHAGFTHPVGQPGGGALVARRHVGAGQALFVVGDGSNFFGPFHDAGAERELHAQQAVQADLGDAVHLAQCLVQLVLAAVLEAPLEGRDDRLAREALAGRALHRQDEGEAELVVVGRVQAVQGGEFVGAAAVQAGRRLLAGRFKRQRARDCGLAGQFRVGAQQGQLFGFAGLRDGVLQRQLEGGQAGEGPLGGGALGNPRRVLVDAAQGSTKAAASQLFRCWSVVMA